MMLHHRQTLVKSFQIAYEGILYTLVTQRNMQIHWIAAGIMMAALVVLNVPKTASIAVFFAISLVICMELMNTAVEKAVDLVTESYHPLAKAAKDVAAAAVFFAAIFACLIGIVVLYEPLVHIQVRTWAMMENQPVLMSMAIIGLLFFITTFIISIRYRHTLNKSEEEESKTV